MDRRSFIRGAVIAVSTPAVIGVAAYDPIITAINEYRDGCRTFATCEMTMDDEDELFETLITEPSSILETWDRPIQSMPGAIAALRLAKDENTYFAGSPVGQRMVEAAVLFLEKHAA